MAATFKLGVSMTSTLQVQDMIDYFISNGNKKKEQSAFILVNMIYLADWLMAYFHLRNFSGLDWKITKYGPRQEELSKLLLVSGKYDTRYDKENGYYVSLKRDVSQFGFEPREKAVLDKVISIASQADNKPTAFYDNISGTYPMLALEASMKDLDLINVAKQARKVLSFEITSLKSELVK